MVKAAPQRKRKAKALPSLADLRARPSLTIPEAMRLTNYGRQKIDTLCDDGDWRWFWEGKRRRIDTQSIFDHQNRLIAQSMGNAA
jgi:hypothetical protein